MSEQEYKEQLQILEDAHKLSKKELAKRFAYSNQKFRVGDIISDGKTTIKISEIKWSIGGGYFSHPTPYLVYCGTKMTKALVPAKKDEINNIVSYLDIKKLN